MSRPAAANGIGMGFHFSTVYVRDVHLAQVSDALVELMGETERLPTRERGLEPTPEASASLKRVRSFAMMPEHDGWVAILEDGQSLDDGGVAEGLSELLQTEVLAFAYSDTDGMWSFTKYWEGQPLEAGGSDGEDFDATALEFIEAGGLPYFGVCYEEVASAAGEDAAALAGSLTVLGDITPRLPIGTQVLTFRRPGKRLPA
ncbi:MAG: hypothetical protein JOZ28_08260 [Candidatus Eremiobacteraeota bacterium]|nr:hypothetical protein [Candidatus Eremiobacteraeota bacterium]